MSKELWSGVFTVKTLPNQIITDTASAIRVVSKFLVYIHDYNIVLNKMS